MLRIVISRTFCIQSLLPWLASVQLRNSLISLLVSSMMIDSSKYKILLFGKPREQECLLFQSSGHHRFTSLGFSLNTAAVHKIYWQLRFFCTIKTTKLINNYVPKPRQVPRSYLGADSARIWWDSDSLFEPVIECGKAHIIHVFFSSNQQLSLASCWISFAFVFPVFQWIIRISFRFGPFFRAKDMSQRESRRSLRCLSDVSYLFHEGSLVSYACWVFRKDWPENRQYRWYITIYHDLSRYNLTINRANISQ